MDLQVLLMCLAIFILSAILLLLIAKVTMREKPFEEVLEEQKQKEIMALQSKPKEPKKEKKKKFKKGKGSDRENDALPKKEMNGEKLKDEKSVEIDLDPEVFEIGTDTEGHPNKNAKPKLVKQQSQSKPIQLNKEERSAIRRDGNAPELIHRKVAPKDFVALKHGEELIRKPSEVPEMAEVVKKVETSKVLEVAKPAEVKINEATVNGSTEQAKKKEKKKKAKEIVEDVVIPEKSTSLKLTSIPPVQPPVNDVNQLPATKPSKKNKAQLLDMNESGMYFHFQLFLFFNRGILNIHVYCRQLAILWRFHNFSQKSGLVTTQVWIWITWSTVVHCSLNISTVWSKIIYSIESQILKYNVRCSTTFINLLYWVSETV